LKTIVCYPIKSLVHAFMPSQCEILALEDSGHFFSQVHSYQPSAVILFSEMFNQPVWEWLPNLYTVVPRELIVVIIPVRRDEELIKRIILENNMANVYVLSSSLSYEEINSHLRMILGFYYSSTDEDDADREDKKARIYSLCSSGNAGVTTFCINYPILMAKRHPDKQIAVIDMNCQKPDLSWFFKLKNYQLSLYRPDLLHTKAAEKRDWTMAFRQSEHLKNLFYSSAAVNWKSYEVSTLLTVLRRRFDYIYLDLGFYTTETEGLQRVLRESTYNLLFSRADPFSLAYASRWITRWKEDSISYQTIISPFDSEEMSIRRIKEIVGTSINGVIPKITDHRMIQSLHNRSILIQEIFPPKQYISGLKEFNVVEKGWEGAAVCE